MRLLKWLNVAKETSLRSFLASLTVSASALGAETVLFILLR